MTMDTFHSSNASKFGIRLSYSYRIMLLNAYVTTYVYTENCTQTNICAVISVKLSLLNTNTCGYTNIYVQ